MSLITTHFDSDTDSEEDLDFDPQSESSSDSDAEGSLEMDMDMDVDEPESVTSPRRPPPPSPPRQSTQSQAQTSSPTSTAVASTSSAPPSSSVGASAQAQAQVGGEAAVAGEVVKPKRKGGPGRGKKGAITPQGLKKQEAARKRAAKNAEMAVPPTRKEATKPAKVTKAAAAAAAAASAAAAAAAAATAAAKSAVSANSAHTSSSTIDLSKPLDAFPWPYSPFTAGFKQQHLRREKMEYDLKQNVQELISSNTNASWQLQELEERIESRRQDLQTYNDDIAMGRIRLRDASLMAIQMIKRLAQMPKTPRASTSSDNDEEEDDDEELRLDPQMAERLSRLDERNVVPFLERLRELSNNASQQVSV